MSSTAATALRRIAWAIAALTAFKTFWLLGEAGWDPAKAPWFFLVALGGPFLLASTLIRRGRTAGVVLMALACSALTVVVVKYVSANGLGGDLAASDYPVLYLGGPLAVVGLFLAIGSLVRRPAAH